jgi:uncharacterized protein
LTLILYENQERFEMNIEELRQKAESGSVVAQTVLGICYLDGVDVDLDYREAFRLLTAAAEKGVPRALVNLARMHSLGLGIPKNPSEAISLYEKAARAGEFFAQIELARLYSRGGDVPVDDDAARRWYSSAAAQDGKIGDCEELREAKAYVESGT